MKTTQPLTKDEHTLFAKQIYALDGALTNARAAYNKTSRIAQQVRRTLRELDQLRNIMDDAYCGQFPDNPRPADPDFMDSPYYSGTIQKAAREKN